MHSLNVRLFMKVALVPLLLLFGALPGRALEIISPPEGSLVARETRLVIKGGDKPPVDAITIAVNGEKSDLLDISSAAYRQSFRDFVFLEVEYDSGVNQIEVEGYAAGKRVVTAKAKVYLPDGVIEPPAPFTSKPFHTAEREALCAGCHHNLNPDAKALANPVPGQNPCSTCHAAVIARKFVHGPAGVYDCAACHEQKSSPFKYAVADRDGNFCGECHDDLLAGLRSAGHVHGPVASGLCLVCHDPHASDAPGLLRTKTLNASCLGCHEKVAGDVHVVRTVDGGSHLLEGPRDPAQPGKPFHCASCHEPHGGVTGKLLRYQAKSSFGLCQHCHKK